MDPPEMSWTEAQRIVLSIAPKFTSLLSLIGSLYIIYHQVILLQKRITQTQQHQQDGQQSNYNNTPNNRNGSSSSSYTYNRILFSLSFCDLISSMGFFMSTWPIPRDDTISVYNIGNQKTCDIQGFVLHFGFASVALYNTCLSVYFLMFVREKVNATMKRKSRKSSTTIRQRKSDININYMNDENRNNNIQEEERTNHFIRRRKIIIEFTFHFISLILPLITATLVYRNGYFNPTPSNCYISEKPRGCAEENSQVECVRGENHRLFLMIFVLVPMFICLSIIIVSMILLYKTVRDLELQTLKKQKSNAKTAEELDSEETITSSNNHTNNSILLINHTSKKVFRLAILYIAAVLFCWIPIFLRLIITRFFVEDPFITFLSGLLVQVFVPLQGCFNALIYKGFNPLKFLCRHLFCVTNKKKIGTAYYIDGDGDGDDDFHSSVNREYSMDESWSYAVFEGDKVVL